MRYLLLALLLVAIVATGIALAGCGGGEDAGGANDGVSTYQPVQCGQPGACT